MQPANLWKPAPPASHTVESAGLRVTHDSIGATPRQGAGPSTESCDDERHIIADERSYFGENVRWTASPSACDSISAARRQQRGGGSYPQSVGARIPAFSTLSTESRASSQPPSPGAITEGSPAVGPVVREGFTAKALVPDEALTGLIGHAYNRRALPPTGPFQEESQ